MGTEQRVTCFIDVQNVQQTVAEHSKAVGMGEHPVFVRANYFVLVDLMLGGRKLSGARFYDGIPLDQERYANRGLHQLIARTPEFQLCVRPLQGIGSTIQKEVDVELATDLVLMARNDQFDTVILVSGDRDFVPAVEKAQSLGKRVEVASFSDALNPMYHGLAARVHHLEELPFLVPMPRLFGSQMKEVVHDDPGAA